jgi:hypothetical protein
LRFFSCIGGGICYTARHPGATSFCTTTIVFYSCVQAPYDLRQNVDRTRNFTYHDADESGNYNPELEARERALELNKRRAAKRAKKIKETETAKKEKVKDKGRKKTKARSRPNKPAVSTPLKEPDRTTRYLTAKDLADIDDGDEDEDEDEDERISLREATPEFIMEDEAGNRGPVTEIQTSFAHPIDFSLSPTTGGCDFCESPIFGMYGYLEKSVHVIKWDTGLGYTEIGGGHCDKHNPTKMCDACSNDRVHINLCESHEMQKIYEVDEQTYENALKDLLGASGTSSETLDQLQRWCSMCSSPASFGCCTLNEDDEVIGCGLRLCESCAFVLHEQFQGSSSAMAEAFDQEPKLRKNDGGEDGLRVRADVGLLSENGLLMKKFLSSIPAAGGESFDLDN